MFNYKKVSAKTVFGFGPHYKACMTKTGTTWTVKVFGEYGSRERLVHNNARDAFKELRFQLHDYEKHYKVWGELLP